MEFRIFTVAAALCCAAIAAQAQSLTIDAQAGINKDGAQASISISTGGGANKNQQKQPYPSSYRGLQLGMQLDDVKKALVADPIYGYRGERDVSLLKSPNRVLIESSGVSFLSRSWFQFYEEKLYTMTFKLDEDRVDFYSVFRSLQDKYGEPTSLDPEKIVWKNDAVTLSLEKPLTLKYIDAQVFKTIQENANIEKNVEELTRQGFLESL